MERGKDKRRNFKPQAMKRKNESKQQQGPPAKKRQPEKPNFQKIHASSVDTKLPEIVPALPPIKDEYAKLVFTHPGSTQRGSHTQDLAHYDRLEFLGDAYLEIIASRLIFENYPKTNAGGMCHLREAVVKNETLSKYSILYGFDKKLVVRDFDYGQHGKTGWVKIYGDVFEAYAAAVVLSDPVNGEKTLTEWLKKLWAPILSEVEEQIVSGLISAKQDLGAKILVTGIKLHYVDERQPLLHVGQGKETFFVGVYLDGWGWKNQHLGSGEGPSKNLAGNEAALKALANHPLIDEIFAKKQAYLAERAAKEEGTKTIEAA